MEISPIIVSMKTASVSIVITFFFSGTGSRIWRGAYPQQKAAAGL